MMKACSDIAIRGSSCCMGMLDGLGGARGVDGDVERLPLFVCVCFFDVLWKTPRLRALWDVVGLREGGVGMPTSETRAGARRAGSSLVLAALSLSGRARRVRWLLPCRPSR